MAIHIIVNRRPLHLASSSARRREILAALGLEFTYAGVHADETRLSGETAEDMARRLALEKAVTARAVRPADEVILGADTVVVLERRILGKPADKAEALHMLAALSGRTHRVLTAVALLFDDRQLTALSSTDVSFREIHPDEAKRYWQSGEPDGKAGGYAVQGLGGIFAERLSGSYSGVVGLPVYETAALLREAGINVLRPADAEEQNEQ